VTFTRPRDLLVAGLGTGLLVHMFLLFDYAALPLLPQLAGVTLLVLAGLEFLLAMSLRSRLRGRTSGTSPHAMTFARALALAKASSLFGAIMCGAWLAVLVYALPRRDQIVAAAHDTVSGAIGLGCAAALVASALWLEHSCRAPDDPERHSRDT